MFDNYENTETLKVEEAAKLMHKNPSFVRCGLRDKRFNFGCAFIITAGGITTSTAASFLKKQVSKKRRCRYD